ncbi:MAG: hypothetical protein U0934_07695 [Pseudotabrizicola sp.]|uniref:hypothetical protein n=1 Tax=Pseudotabrizicola sp. TaxID=2939647 RepID=UPI002716FF9C|nr:hypothetical protein [Pseudotabrizicola sp.]MDO8883512.1 hypothetical protein [Pseudotabrizicola sp.]MDP2080334.1 hypothetical protein [Pseudotabrizicola sp.]MDZ7573823.1 hypothetical protein [Pseudotabrizicola sp.]
MNSVQPALTAQTRVIPRSESLGFPPFVVGSDRRAETGVTACASTLQGLGQTEPGRAMLKLLYLDSVSAGNASLFDGIFARMAVRGGG